MRKQQIIAIIILAAMFSALPLVYAAETLQKPNVSLPSGWELDDETAYPDAVSEHDPDGAGAIQYVNPENNDEVKIFYERAQSTYSDAQLKAEAEALFERDLEEWTYSQSGTKTFDNGVSYGFAKGYDSEVDAYIEDIVFVKDNYYINALAFYDANTESENEALSIIKSVSTGGSLFGGSMLFIIIGVVAAVIVVVVVVVVVMRKKKQSQPQQAAAPQFNYPPPPPPA